MVAKKYLLKRNSEYELVFDYGEFKFSPFSSLSYLEMWDYVNKTFSLGVKKDLESGVLEPLENLCQKAGIEIRY